MKLSCEILAVLDPDGFYCDVCKVDCVNENVSMICDDQMERPGDYKCIMYKIVQFLIFKW